MTPVAPTAVLTPSERLTRSRERLRLAMLPVTTNSGGRGGHGIDGPWLARLKGLPGFDFLSQALRVWWARHPLHNVGLLLADAAKPWLQPVAKRNPLLLVLGAAVLGGLFAWSRPWRWVLKPAVMAGLLPQLLSKAMGHVPPASWMTILASLAAQPRK